MTRARSVAEVIAGEAVSGTPEQRMADMMAIASVISNRAALLGVTPEQVVSNSREFNAYNRALPPGVNADIVAMAQQAIDEVATTGPVTDATFYATPTAADNLPNGLSFETSTAGHQFYSDPQNRAIGTSEGFVQPNAYAYAANLENIPTPTKSPAAIPTDNPALLAGAPLAGVDPNLAFGVADPVNNLPAPDLATAQTFEKAAPATNPWGGAPLSNVAASGVLAGTNPMEAATSTQNNGVMAGLQSDGYSQMAAAGPFGGNYAAPEDRFAPSPGVMSGIPAGQQITQADIERGLFNATGANEMDPAFTEALMSAENPVVPTAVESQTFTPEEQSVDIASSRFSTPAKTSRIGQPQPFDVARMPALVDPALNTASFTPQPADLGSMPEAYAAQRQAPTGLNSAEMQAMQGHVYNEALKAEAARQAAANGVLSGMPSSVTSTVPAVDTAGVMATPNFTAAVNPSLPGLSVPSAVNAFAAQPTVTPAEQAIADIAAPATSSIATPQQQAAAYQQAADSFAKAGMLNIGQQPPTNLSGELPTNFDVLGTTAPSLETVEVADQPAVSDQQVDIPGPATTSAVDQQQAAVPDIAPATISRTTPVKTTPTATDKGVLSGLMSKEALGGGVLAGLVGGPIAAPLGVLAGMTVAKGGGLTGLLSPTSFSAPTNQIPGGVNSIAGIYGGAQPVGTYAVANNGMTITAQPGGWTTTTNKYGVTEAVGPDGKISSYFGGLDQDHDAPSPGGFGASGGYAPG